MGQWRHEKKWGGVLGDLPSSGQLDVYQVNDYPKHPQKGSHQVYRFFLA